MSILYRNLNRWSIRNETLLLITAAYPGSGKSTLAKKIASTSPNILLIQTDTLYIFLKLKKNHPIEARGMNIIEFEHLLKDPSFTYEYKEQILICIQFIKTQLKDLYQDLIIHRFGEDYYPIGENIHDDKPEWSKWMEYLLTNFRHYSKLVIVEGGQLLAELIKDSNQELLNNIPLIIVDTPRLRAYYQVGLRYVQERHLDTNPFKKYLEILYWMYTRLHKGSVQNIYNRNEEKIKILKDKNLNFNIDSTIKNSKDFNIDILPEQLEELKLYNNWVVYRNFKYGKLPFNPITHLAVKTNNPSTWSDYDSALLCYQNHSYDGIGFVFNNNQYVGIDLDDCISNNIIDPFALEIVNLINSYTEYSPSNKGLHIICKSKLLYNIGIKKDKIEVYSYNRFFTITGNIYMNQRIEYRDKELQILLQKINSI